VLNAMGIGHFADQKPEADERTGRRRPTGARHTANCVETAENSEDEEFIFVVSSGIRPGLAVNIGSVPNIKL